MYVTVVSPLPQMFLLLGQMLRSRFCSNRLCFKDGQSPTGIRTVNISFANMMEDVYKCRLYKIQSCRIYVDVASIHTNVQMHNLQNSI